MNTKDPGGVARNPAAAPSSSSQPNATYPYRHGVFALREVFLRGVPATTRLRFATTVLMTLFVSICAALSPIAFSRAIDALNGKASGDAIFLLFATVAAWGSAKLLIEARWLVYQPAENRFLAAVREHYLSHILALSAQFHADRSIGKLETIVGQGISGLRSLLSALFTQFAPVAFEIIVVLVAFSTVLSFELAFIVCVTIGLYIVLLIFGAERLSIRFSAALDSSISAQGRAGDAILNAEGIKAMALETMIAARYGSAIATMYSHYLVFYYARGVFGIALGTVLITGFGITLSVAFFGVLAGTLSIGQLVLVNALLLQLFRSIEGFSFSYRDSRQAISSVSRFVELLSEPREEDVGKVGLSDIISRIDIRNVSFQYPDGRTGLMPISLSLEKGRIVALLGPSGSGKSTLVRLLLKLYPISKGEIWVGGVELRDVAANDLRRHCAIVPQDPILFRDTLAFNITLSEDFDPAHLSEAIRKAQLSDLLGRLPEGPLTEIGERGVKVSGGERQRIGLARIFYRQPQVLLLDEVTSALDGTTRDDVLEIIKAVSQGCITLLITHDPDVAAIADEVVILDVIEEM